MQVHKFGRAFNTRRRLKSHAPDRSEDVCGAPRSMARWWEKEELAVEKAEVALNCAQRAADKKVIAEWRPILGELGQPLKDQPVYRSRLFKLGKALYVDIRKTVKFVL